MRFADCSASGACSCDWRAIRVLSLARAGSTAEQSWRSGRIDHRACGTAGRSRRRTAFSVGALKTNDQARSPTVAPRSHVANTPGAAWPRWRLDLGCSSARLWSSSGADQCSVTNWELHRTRNNEQCACVQDPGRAEPARLIQPKAGASCPRQLKRAFARPIRWPEHPRAQAYICVQTWDQ